MKIGIARITPTLTAVAALHIGKGGPRQHILYCHFLAGSD
jgi:hypothetical protein